MEYIVADKQLSLQVVSENPTCSNSIFELSMVSPIDVETPL